MLSFRHEVFIEVALNLSFTKASMVLHISQPAISKHIKSLEDYYKTSLFERQGSSIYLTETGKILLDYLIKAREIQKQLEFDLSTFQDVYNAKGELKLGSSTTVALYIIPPVLSAFHKKYPFVKIRLVNRNSENILKALLEKEIDLGIIDEENKLPSVRYQHFLTDEVIAVCSSKSELAYKEKIEIRELPKIPLVLRESGSGTLAAVKRTLQKDGIKLSDLNVTIRLGGTEALKNFLLADNSMGFLPMRSVSKELANNDLVRLNIEDFHILRHFYFIQRPGTENDKLNKSFIKMALHHYNH